MLFNQNNKQKGFSLAVVLMLITVLGGVLVGLTNNNRGSVRQDAEISGWELAQIARAARIFSRNQIMLTPTLVQDLSLTGSGPQEISINNLIGDAMLPANFLRQREGSYQTALGQNIRIILANYPVDGDPNDVTTVPTAYVYVERNEKTNNSIIQDIVQEVRRQGASVSAPIFINGINETGSCDGGGDTAILWDTGCMTTDDFTVLTGEVFTEGDFVIPTWRAVNFDTRAIMRFPHPENTGLPTMLTTLKMGEIHDCDTDPSHFIDVPTDNGMNASAMCGAQDDIAGVDNRRDILNSKNIHASSMIIDPQSSSDTFEDTNGVLGTRIEEVYALNINGGLVVGGDAKIYDGDVEIDQDLTIDKNIFATNNGVGAGVTARVTSLSVSDSSSSNLNVANTPTITGNISAQADLRVPGAVQINDSLVTEVLQMTGVGAAQVNVNQSANMLGTSQIQKINVNGSVPLGTFDYVTAEIQTQNINLTGGMNAGQSLSILDSTTASNIEITNEGAATCYGDCPRRILDEACRNWTGISYEDCINGL